MDAEATERITILLQAKDADFQRQLDRNNKALAKFEREATRNVSGAAKKIDANLQSMAASVGNFAVGFAGGLIGAGIGIAVSATLGQIESLIEGLGDLQDQADILDLNVEELQGLRYGFQLAGVDADKLNTGLQRFTSLVGDAAEGQGALAKVFSAAGVPLTDMNGELRSSSDLLREFADIMAATPEGAERLALATEVFGKAGRNLVLGLEGGRSGLDAMVEEARKAGAVLDEELVRRAEEIGDKWDALKMRIVARLEEIAVATAEALARAADEVTLSDEEEAAAEALGNLLEIAREFQTALRGQADYLSNTEQGARVAESFYAAADGIDAMRVALAEGRMTQDEFAIALDTTISKSMEAVTALSAIDDLSMDNAMAVISGLAARVGVLAGAAEAAARAMAAATLSGGALPALRGPAGAPAWRGSDLAPQSSVRPEGAPPMLGEPSLGGGRRSGGGISDDAREAQRVFEATRTEAEKYQAALAKLDELQAKGLLTSETYARAVDDLGEKYLDAGDAAEFWSDKGADLQSDLLDAAEDADTLSESMENLARSIARALAQAALWGTGPLASGGSNGLLGGLWSMAFGGARATGGSVSRGKAYLVNEDTPNSELFVPSQNGAVLTVAQAQAALRGGAMETSKAYLPPEYFTAPNVAKAAANTNQAQPRGFVVGIGFDESVGSLTAMVRDEAGRVVAQAAPQIVGRSVQAVRQQAGKTKAFLGG